MKTVLTIAGSDCSGGAGIQADIKTMTCHGVYAMSAITALTAQNTTGVYGVMNVEPEFLAKQLDCIFTDIYPDAVKIGMVSSGELIRVIAQKLKEYKANNIVLDPVMVSTSGSRLMEDTAQELLKSELFPLADIITPNIPEAEVIGDIKITEPKQCARAAQKMRKYFNGAILIKGGHFADCADDFLYIGNREIRIRGERIANPNTHGTGCTLSSAIASNLALGYDIEQAVIQAKEYLRGALLEGLDLGQGSGPVMHNYQWKQD